MYVVCLYAHNTYVCMLNCVYSVCVYTCARSTGGVTLDCISSSLPKQWRQYRNADALDLLETSERSTGRIVC